MVGRRPAQIYLDPPLPRSRQLAASYAEHTPHCVVGIEGEGEGKGRNVAACVEAMDRPSGPVRGREPGQRSGNALGSAAEFSVSG